LNRGGYRALPTNDCRRSKMRFFELDETAMNVIALLADDEISLEEANEILQREGNPLELTEVE